MIQKFKLIESHVGRKIISSKGDCGCRSFVQRYEVLFSRKTELKDGHFCICASEVRLLNKVVTTSSVIGG